MPTLTCNDAVTHRHLRRSETSLTGSDDQLSSCMARRNRRPTHPLGGQ